MSVLHGLRFIYLGTQIHPGRIASRYSSAAVVQDLIKSPVSVEYDKLLINGKFVEAASGKLYTVLPVVCSQGDSCKFFDDLVVQSISLSI